MDPAWNKKEGVTRLSRARGSPSPTQSRPLASLPSSLPTGAMPQSASGLALGPGRLSSSPEYRLGFPPSNPAFSVAWAGPVSVNQPHPPLPFARTGLKANLHLLDTATGQSLLLSLLRRCLTEVAALWLLAFLLLFARCFSFGLALFLCHCVDGASVRLLLVNVLCSHCL